MPVIDVLRFEGRLDRTGYVATPLVEAVLVGTVMGVVFLASTYAAPPSVGNVVLGVAAAACLVQGLLCILSCQWRRLKDVGFPGYHVLWIDGGLGYLSQSAPRTWVVVGLFSSAFFLLMPGMNQEEIDAGTGPMRHVLDVLTLRRGRSGKDRRADVA